MLNRKTLSFKIFNILRLRVFSQSKWSLTTTEQTTDSLNLRDLFSQIRTLMAELLDYSLLALSLSFSLLRAHCQCNYAKYTTLFVADRLS